MKLIYVIVDRDIVEYVTGSLNREGYQATILSSTGGFLKKGNSTIMICTENENLQKVIKLIKGVCGERTTIDVDIPYSTMSHEMQTVPVWTGGIKQKIEVGGAVIIAVDACYYEKI